MIVDFMSIKACAYLGRQGKLQTQARTTFITMSCRSVHIGHELQVAAWRTA